MQPRDDFATSRAVDKSDYNEGDDDSLPPPPPRAAEDDDDSLPPPPPRDDGTLPAGRKTPESPSAASAETRQSKESASKLGDSPQRGKPAGALKDRMKAFQNRNDNAAAEALDNPFGRQTNPAQLLAVSKPPSSVDTTAEVKDTAEDKKAVSGAGIERRKC